MMRLAKFTRTWAIDWYVDHVKVLTFPLSEKEYAHISSGGKPRPAPPLSLASKGATWCAHDVITWDTPDGMLEDGDYHEWPTAWQIGIADRGDRSPLSLTLRKSEYTVEHDEAKEQLIVTPDPPGYEIKGSVVKK